MLTFNIHWLGSWFTFTYINCGSSSGTFLLRRIGIIKNWNEINIWKRFDFFLFKHCFFLGLALCGWLDASYCSWTKFSGGEFHWWSPSNGRIYIFSWNDANVVTQKHIYQRNRCANTGRLTVYYFLCVKIITNSEMRKTSATVSRWFILFSYANGALSPL